jgi:hypothetical protein
MRSAGVMMRMQWRGGALLSRRRSAHGKNRSDKSFRSSEISVIIGSTKNRGPKRVTLAQRFRAKTAKRKADQPIENKRFHEIARFRAQ